METCEDRSRLWVGVEPQSYVEAGIGRTKAEAAAAAEEVDGCGRPAAARGHGTCDDVGGVMLGLSPSAFGCAALPGESS